MMRKHEAAPPRGPDRYEGEAHAVGELCIRFMERAMEGVIAHPVLKEFYDDFLILLGDTVQDEVKQFAFDYAYELWSDEDVIRSRRFAFEREAAGETPRPKKAKT